MSDEIHSIFDKSGFDAEDGMTVPVVVETGQGKRQVGEAKLTKDGQGVHAEIYLKNDDPNEVVEFLKGGLTGLSIGDSRLDVSEEDAQALFEFEGHDHRPVQHRDGREAWCNFCGLSVDLREPTSNMPRLGKPESNFGFPKPSRLHNNEGEN